MSDAEVWKPVVGYSGFYEVSDAGRVRSLDCFRIYQRFDFKRGKIVTVRRAHKGKILRAGKTSTGHLSVALGKGSTRMVHVLVLEAFVGPAPKHCETCHLDGNRANNSLGNLRWATRSENLHNAVRTGNKKVGKDVRWSKLTDENVAATRAMFGATAVTKIARHFGVNESTVRQIRDGKAWRGINPGGGRAIR